jgi:hypothetical protein
MQIYGILLNIRGKTENFVEFCGIFTENTWKIIPFYSISFLNLLPDDPFSRLFSVVFGRFCGHFRRKMENIGEIFPFSFLFFPLHYTSFLFIPQPLDFLPQMLNLTRYNKKVIFLFGRT